MRFNTIGKRIGFGYVSVILVLLMSSLVARWQTGELSAISHRLRTARAPTLENSVQLVSLVKQAQTALRSWVFYKESAFREEYRSSWKMIEKKEKALMELSPSLSRLRERLARLREVQDRIEATARVNQEQAMDRLRTVHLPLYEAAIAEGGAIVANQNALMDQDLEAENKIIKDLNLIQILLWILGALISALIGYIVVRSVARPIQDTTHLADQIARGDYAQTVEIVGTEEVNRLGAALEGMRASLERQSWLRDAQIGFYEAIRGASSVRELADEALAQIARLTKAQVGALYLTEGEKLRIVGGYAYPQERRPGGELGRGEGLAGQVASERKAMTVFGEEGKELSLNTSLGSIRPQEIYASPMTYKDETVGVLELGFSTPSGAQEREFIQIVSPAAAIALSAAQKSEQVRNLLHETQAQAEELQSQQEELRNANEELQTRQEELEATNEELEEQKTMLEAAQTKLNERAGELDRISRYKSQFLANVSHELRTPLNSQLILSKLLEENKDGNLTPKQLEFAKAIHSSGAGLLQLINDILDLSKVEAGKLSLEVKDEELEGFIQDLEREFRSPIERKGIAFVVQRGADLPERFRTDRHRLAQILRNFLSNALKFTEQGEIRLLAERTRDDLIAFRVSDSGIGIPKAKQEMVFQAFEQADSTTSRKYGGTGLGLAISKNLASLLGGKITLESEEGKGSRFSVLVPETLGEASSPQPVVTKKSDERSNEILIIEDDPVFADILVGFAREKGFAARVISDGDQGLTEAKAIQPLCILLDYRLPGMDGLKILKALKSDPMTESIPVHMISVDDHAEEALSLGAVGHLKKASDPKEIRNVLDQLESVVKKPIQKVLIVEDDSAQQAHVAALLEKIDLAAVVAGSGEEALRALQKNGPFDCMILDLKLPDMTGVEFLRKLREDEAFVSPPVVFYTAGELSADEERELRRYSDSIIIKGTRSDERLLDEVSLFIHRVIHGLSGDAQRLLAAGKNPEQGLKDKKILVVDDDVRNVFALSSALESNGMKVIVAREGQEALEELKRHRDIDLVLMDVMMPVMDGLEATRRIRKDPAHGRLPVIALTAKAMKGDQEACLKAGASDYLPKPIDVDRLLTLLRVWLAKK